MSATSSRSTRAPPGARAASAMVRSRLRRDSMFTCLPFFRPRALAAPSRKPRTIANSSGSSSRKASWPLSVTISANETRAPEALSACTMARDSGVGNSQSEVNDTTQKRVSRAAEGVGHHAVVVGGEIEIVHRARQVEIGVGVEALDERAALMAQIGFHLEIGVERERRILAVLELAAELAMQRRVRKIGDVRAHARDREAAPRARALGEIAAVAPFRIGHHRLAADLVERDVLRRMPRRAGDRQRARTRAWDSSPPIAAPACRPSSRRPPRTACRSSVRRAASPARAPCRGW